MKRLLLLLLMLCTLYLVQAQKRTDLQPDGLGTRHYGTELFEDSALFTGALIGNIAEFQILTTPIHEYELWIKPNPYGAGVLKLGADAWNNPVIPSDTIAIYGTTRIEGYATYNGVELGTGSSDSNFVSIAADSVFTDRVSSGPTSGDLILDARLGGSGRLFVGNDNGEDDVIIRGDVTINDSEALTVGGNLGSSLDLDGEILLNTNGNLMWDGNNVLVAIYGNVYHLGSGSYLEADGLLSNGYVSAVTQMNTPLLQSSTDNDLKIDPRGAGMAGTVNIGESNDTTNIVGTARANGSTIVTEEDLSTISETKETVLGWVEDAGITGSSEATENIVSNALGYGYLTESMYFDVSGGDSIQLYTGLQRGNYFSYPRDTTIRIIVYEVIEGATYVRDATMGAGFVLFEFNETGDTLKKVAEYLRNDNNMFASEGVANSSFNSDVEIEGGKAYALFPWFNKTSGGSPSLSISSANTDWISRSFKYATNMGLSYNQTIHSPSGVPNDIPMTDITFSTAMINFIIRSK